MARMPAEERRRQLVDVAINVACRDGVAAVTTRSVANEAGVPPGLVHYVFHSMDDLFRDMIKMIVDSQVQLVESVASGSTDVEHLIRGALTAYWSTVEADPERHLLTYEVTQHALRRPELSDLAAWQYRCYFEAMQSIVEQAAANAGIEWTLPTPTIARMFVTIIDGLTLSWLAERNTPQAVEVFTALAEQMAALTRPAGE